MIFMGGVHPLSSNHSEQTTNFAVSCAFELSKFTAQRINYSNDIDFEINS